MEFVRGNLALRDHGETGKDVYLFEEAERGLRYRDQMVVAGYYELDGVADGDGNPRRAIVFQLAPLDDIAPSDTHGQAFANVAFVALAA